MSPQDLIPVSDSIPVHWGWFQFLLILTFILHLLFMNTMLGSGIIALIREFHTGREAEEMNRDLSKKLPYTVAFTVNMGVAPLLFLQVLYGHFMYTSSILMAVYWLSLVLVIIIAYYSIYLYDFKFDALGSARKIFITISVFLLLWTGFVFTNNMTLMIQPEKWARYFINPFGTLLNLKEPMLIPRYLHFVTASVAVAGLFQATLQWFKFRDRTEAAEVKSGLNWYAGATFVQLLIGLWFLLSLPSEKTILFLGKGSLHTFFLFCGIVSGVMSLFFAARYKLWPTVVTSGLTIVMMVLVRDLLRASYLKPYFSPRSLTVLPEYSPMVLFLIAFAAGIVIIVYILKLAASAGKEG